MRNARMGERSKAFAIATALMLAFALGSLATALDYRGDYQERYPRYADTGSNAPPSLPHVQHIVVAPKYKTPCQNPQGHDEADLCAQWRAANAAKQTAEWSLWQLFLSGFGVAGLVVTLWYNQRSISIASRSARDAARAAKAAVDQHRAWLKVRLVHVMEVNFLKATKAHPEYISIEVSIDLENVGGGPATDVIWEAAVWAQEATASQFDEWEALWKNEIEAYTNRIKEHGIAEDYGFILWPNDPPENLRHGANTLTWPVKGAMPIDSNDPQPFRLMGIVIVFYRISSGDRAMTAVPFVIHVGPPGFTYFEYLREHKSINANDIRLTRLEGAERAT